MKRLSRASTAIAGLLFFVAAGGASAGENITPGLAAGGVPLTADVATVGRLLGEPTDEFLDPTNPRIHIQRWEALCLGARYGPQGGLIALDVWVDPGDSCRSASSEYGVRGRGGERIDFTSRREDVKRAFGYRPDRVLRGSRFTILVYDAQGIAFYIRSTGERSELVDTITVFPRQTSGSVWTPGAWGAP